jgi:transcriptional antiterminator NusG
MHHNWFAIRTKSNRESAICEALRGKGYEVLCPRYRETSIHITNPRRKSSPPPLKPLFPGYLFCKFDVLERLPILVIPGVMNVVSNGRIPIPLDETEIESLKVLVRSSLSLNPHPYLKVGDRVIISHGPLAGASGCIVQTDRNRLIVSITLLQRSVAVDVASEWLEKCHESSNRVGSASAPLLRQAPGHLPYGPSDSGALRIARPALYRP